MRKILLFPAAIIYKILIWVWDISWYFKKPHKIKSKVISVGNINTGGTGKTTLVKYISKKLMAKGYKVAVIAKGYKRPGPKTNIVCTPEDCDWTKHGDEPAALSMSADVKVYIGENKTDAALMAEQDNYDFLIIDDGFQHRGLYRDIDIVCLTGEDILRKSFLIPAGNLREPVSSLKRAHILITFDNIRLSKDIRKKNLSGRRLFLARKTISGVFDKKKQKTDISKSKVLAFCGIANPDSFRDSLIQSGCTILDLFQFKDHHIYSTGEIDLLMRAFKNLKAEKFVTTLKDFVKLEKFWPESHPLYYLDIDAELENEDQFFRIIENEI